ncbi:MAG: anti-sigma factor [Solirubrobacterales bacterium]
MSPRSHETWKDELPSYLLGALSPGERADLEYHLGGCAECQAELRWLEPARETLVSQVEQVEPSPNLKKNLMAAVAADLEENPALEPEPAEAHVTEPVTPRERQENAFKPRRQSWFSQLLRPAVVGSLAVVLFAGVIVGYGLNGGDGGNSEPVVAQRVIPGQSNVGNADATMVVSGKSGTLSVAHLPKIDDDEVYQAWIQKGQKIEATDSLFTPSRDGTATASIPDLNGVDVVMVSVEPKGGSQQPTSPPIITIETT